MSTLTHELDLVEEAIGDETDLDLFAEELPQQVQLLSDCLTSGSCVPGTSCVACASCCSGG
jgi:hypothetical protein